MTGPRMHAPAAAPADRVDGAGMRIAIVAARFNGQIVELLLDGARACLAEHGVAPDAVQILWVPGAFELPLAADRAARTGRFEAVVCLGVVVRGETPHFDFVAGEAARGIQEVALRTGVPVSFGVLTTETVDQALERAGGEQGNKGWDAALAALEMVHTLDGLVPRQA